MNADGSESRNLTDDLGGGNPVWSPDGTRIAFECVGGICVVNGDGSDPRNLANGGNPVWSPDGTKIAFERKFGSGYYEYTDIHVMNSDGSNPTNLTKGGGD
jgi:Tol biopolymer transport system component